MSFRVNWLCVCVSQGFRTRFWIMFRIGFRVNSAKTIGGLRPVGPPTQKLLICQSFASGGAQVPLRSSVLHRKSLACRLRRGGVAKHRGRVIQLAFAAILQFAAAASFLQCIRSLPHRFLVVFSSAPHSQGP